MLISIFKKAKLIFRISIFFIVPYKGTKYKNEKNNTNRNKYNDLVVKKLAEKHKISTSYVRKSLKGDRTGIFPDLIKKEYKELNKLINDALDNF